MFSSVLPQVAIDYKVLITSSLFFTPNLNKIPSKLYRSLCLIRREVWPSRNTNIKRTPKVLHINVTLFRSHITCCCQIWRSYINKNLLKILERLQQQASTYIHGFRTDYKKQAYYYSLSPRWIMGNSCKTSCCFYDWLNTLQIITIFVTTSTLPTLQQTQHQPTRLHPCLALSFV